MDELDVRRMYISDEQWERTSSSWKALKPKKNFNEIDLTDETVTEYRERLLPKYDIPYEVLDQWIYGLYYNSETVDNYGWIDLSTCSFSLEAFDCSALESWRVIDRFSTLVLRREASSAYDEFMCKPEDLEHWKDKHTWRVPPVVLDVSSLPPIPDHADIGGTFQLIEGHNRLGYLRSVRRCNKPLKETHLAYVLLFRSK